MGIIRDILLNEQRSFNGWSFFFNKCRCGTENLRILIMVEMKTVLAGYGSNMSTQYLIKRKNYSLEGQAAFLEDYQLIMNMEEPNFLEPSFANIRLTKGLQ